MAEIQWVKLSTGVFENRKIRQIETMPDYDAIILVWVMCIALAGKLNREGKLLLTQEIPYTCEMLAREFRRPVNTLEKAMQVFIDFEMMEKNQGVYSIKNWCRYQSVEKMDKIREQNRIRVQRFRQKQSGNVTSNVTSNVTVTQGNGIEKDKEIEKEKNILVQTGFATFWKAYPKKRNKGDAEAVFYKANFTQSEIEKMICVLERLKKSVDWVKDGGKYIPYPARWLRAKGWEDEVEGGTMDANRNEL